MNIIELLPENLKEELAAAIISEESFITEDKKELFTDKLFLKNNKSKNECVYIFCSSSNNPKKNTANEFFKALLNLKNTEFNPTQTFILYNDKLFSTTEFLTTLPINSESFAPDFEYILKDITEAKDSKFQTDMKIKIFSEVIKFILKDPELYDLSKTLFSK